MLEATPAFVANCLIVGGAILFARFTKPDEVVPATIVASVLALVWVNTILSFTPYGIPAMLPLSVNEYGWTWGGPPQPLPGGLSVDTWAIADMLAGLTVLVVARDKWWGKCIYGLLLAGCVFHASYWARVCDWASYQRGLDMTFMAEEALFFAIGAGGVSDWITSNFGAGRNILPRPRLLARQALKRRA